MTKREMVWAVAFENALAKRCELDGRCWSFNDPERDDIEFARQWANEAASAVVRWKDESCD